MGADVAKLGQSSAFKKKWIRLVDGKLTKLATAVVDEVQQDLLILSKSAQHHDAEVLKELKRRKLIEST